jgi:nitrogen regulatory protein PII
MEPNNTMITFIVNHGEAYDIMTAARKAGAKGGTIVNAHGTSKEEDIKFFGMSLMSEKEMLLIVAEQDLAQKILHAVKDLPVFKKPGGGIIYTTEVNRFIHM